MEIDELLIHSRNAIEASKQGITALWCSELSIDEEIFVDLYNSDAAFDFEIYEGKNNHTVIVFEIAEYTFSTRMKTVDYFEMTAQKRSHRNAITGFDI